MTKKAKPDEAKISSLAERYVEAAHRWHAGNEASTTANAEMHALHLEMNAENASLEALGEKAQRISPDALLAQVPKLTANRHLQLKRYRVFDQSIVALDRGDNIRRERSKRRLYGATPPSNPPPAGYGGGLNGAGAARQKSGSDPLRAWR